jgi:hypothetical protein
MKQIIKTVFLLLVVMLSCLSCEEILSEEDAPVATTEFYNTEEGYEDAATGAYSYLRSYYCTGENGLSATVFGTDEFTNGSDGGRKYLNQYTSSLNAEDSNLKTIWTNLYKGINCTNIVIDRADQVEDMDQTTIDTRVGEAKFLRALYYFLLVQTWGEVTLEINETTELTTEAFRESIENIYDQIVKDLDSAIENLPETQSDYGRATMYAALHLSSKVHLTRATMDNTIDASEEYQRALDDATLVIESGQFALLDDFEDVWEEGDGEINDEVIWSVQYSDDDLTGGSNTAHMYFLMAYDTEQGMVRDVENGRPFKRFKPNDYALDVFDRDIDSRYEKSFKTVFYCNNPEDVVFYDNTTYMEEGDTAIWLPGEELDITIIKSKDFLVLTPASYTSKLYPTLTKYLDPTRESASDADGSRDVLVCRLAETYLIAAEAEFGLGDNDAAATWMNVVRRRAAYDGMETDMEVSGSDITLEFILEERTRELMGEMHRWFDLVRTGTLVERVQLYNAEAADNIQDYHVLRPIPQDQIDRTYNSDGTVYGQNTGY